MSKLIEVIDSLNNENASEVKEQLTKEATALRDNNRQLYTRAKKAEGFEYNKESKEWTKKEKPEEKPELKKSKEDKPDLAQEALKYAQKTFLEGRGYKNVDDQKLIFDECERLKMTPEAVIDMAHMKSNLKDSKDQREAESAAPDSKGRGSGKTQDKPDYWIAKGKMPKDQKLAEKVVNAKIKSDDSNKMFEDIE